MIYCTFNTCSHTLLMSICSAYTYQQELQPNEYHTQDVNAKETYDTCLIRLFAASLHYFCIV